VWKGAALARDSHARRVTVADIAAAAGVSRATVSKVLNGRSDVAAETRALIAKLLDEREYVPTKRTKGVALPAAGGGLIEMLFNDAATPWAVEMVRGTEETARAARAGVVVSTLGSGPNPGQRWVEDVAARRSRGLILALSQLSAGDQKLIAKLGVPAILVDPVGDVDSDFPSIGSDNWGGGMAATRHLIELGHQRIGTIAGPLRFLCSQARLAGYRAALERAGIPADERLIAPGDFHYRAAYESALALLDLADPPTAIFAANDEQALAVYAAAHRRGLRIPQHLSVIGFDDVPMSQWVTPPLTTVRQPITELATLATRTVLHGGDLGGPGPGLPGRVELPTTLVVRDSTARRP